MKALTVLPKKADTLQVRDVPEPKINEGDLLCEMLMIGICGTDMEIRKGNYGEAPENSEYLIIGHESLGRVMEAPAGSGFNKGDLVMGFVRRKDPLPCNHCAADEWDFCENNLYQERGIKGLAGYASERFSLEAEYALKIDEKISEVGVLVEPASVVAKAWEQVTRIAARTALPPHTALITGAGPIGLLAAMIGVQKGFSVHVLDHNETGIKPALVKALGATYHSDLDALERSGARFEVTVECTGNTELILNLFNHIKPDGILCLAGVSACGQNYPVDVGKLNLNIVLQNEVIFGSVNANRRHYEAAQRYLLAADLEWLKKLITRKVPLAKFAEAFQKQKTDIKVALIP
jgi:threonine dehydrogenase-like Zn-dependent dehydrogenase